MEGVGGRARGHERSGGGQEVMEGVGEGKRSWEGWGRARGHGRGGGGQEVMGGVGEGIRSWEG